MSLTIALLFSQKLKKILLEDELGICADLENDMATLIDSYVDEWKQAVTDPALRKQFRQFVNTVSLLSILTSSQSLTPELQDERRLAIEPITERGQQRPADWPKAFPPVKFELKDIVTPREEWKWIPLASVDDLQPSESNTTSAAVRYGEDSQLAIFHVPKRGYFATQQMCPHKRAFVLEHGIIGDDGESTCFDIGTRSSALPLSASSFADSSLCHSQRSSIRLVPIAQAQL